MNATALSPWRWPLYFLGTAAIGYGLWGQVYGADTKPVRVGVLVVAAALAHDLVLAPLIVLLGLLARRFLPRRARGAVQGGALIALCLTLVALPGLGRFGARADNPSVLPRDYTEGLLLALLVTALSVGLQILRRRRQHLPTISPGSASHSLSEPTTGGPP